MELLHRRGHHPSRGAWVVLKVRGGPGEQEVASPPHGQKVRLFQTFVSIPSILTLPPASGSLPRGQNSAAGDEAGGSALLFVGQTAPEALTSGSPLGHRKRV